MGGVDTVSIRCHKCKKNTISQTKILGECDLINFEIGSNVMFNDLSNCILRLKDKCPFCNSYNAIKIRDRVIINVENPKNADCIEKSWGEYKFDDLKNILNLKLEKENGKR